MAPPRTKNGARLWAFANGWHTPGADTRRRSAAAFVSRTQRSAPVRTPRRAQSRLARMQSWSCLTNEKTPEKRRARILEEIAGIEDDDLGLKSLEGGNAPDLIVAKLTEEIAKLRATLQNELVRIADRILPLRGRHWEWVPRPNDLTNFVLRRTPNGSDGRKKLVAGQRGLSIRRILQLESLRQRCQSLNRALRQVPGEPAKLGRSKRGSELPDPCPEILERLDALKEQRVNQTAHLILAQALGLRLRPHKIEPGIRETRDIHGDTDAFPDGEPVDFIVIENLKYYETTQGRSRKENARLMLWCRRQLRKKLIELCAPYRTSRPGRVASRHVEILFAHRHRRIPGDRTHARRSQRFSMEEQSRPPRRSRKVEKAFQGGATRKANE